MVKIFFYLGKHFFLNCWISKAISIAHGVPRKIQSTGTVTNGGMFFHNFFSIFFFKITIPLSPYQNNIKCKGK